MINIEILWMIFTFYTAVERQQNILNVVVSLTHQWSEKMCVWLVIIFVIFDSQMGVVFMCVAVYTRDLKWCHIINAWVGLRNVALNGNNFRILKCFKRRYTLIHMRRLLCLIETTNVKANQVGLLNIHKVVSSCAYIKGIHKWLIEMF